MSLSVTEPNGKGMGWKISPLWLGVETHSKESRDIAYMVSAAPEMLELLEDLETNVFIYRNNELHTKMDKVLKKARGE